MNIEIWKNRVKDCVFAIKNGKDMLSTLITARVDELLKENKGAVMVEVGDYKLGTDNHDEDIVVWFGESFECIIDLAEDEVIEIAEKLERDNYTIITNNGNPYDGED